MREKTRRKKRGAESGYKRRIASTIHTPFWLRKVFSLFNPLADVGSQILAGKERETTTTTSS